MNPDPNPIRQHNDDVADMFSDMPPFSIVVNNGHDAAWISSAMMQYLTGGDGEAAERALKMIITRCKQLGVEKGVTEFFDVANKEKIIYPAFIKPVLILMIGHALEKYKEEE